MKLINNSAMVTVGWTFCALVSLGQQTPAPANLTQQSPPAETLPDAPTSNAPIVLQPTGPTAVLDTSMGRITCRLFQNEAPETVANFIGLAEGKKDWMDPATHKKMHNKPLYNGTVFHRVIPDFMIQGGDPTATGMGDPGYSFKDEFNANLNFDLPGRLAMANSGPDTNGSQFFITEATPEHLNQKHTIFGQCNDSGVNVVKSIARVERDSNDKPVVDVVLTKITIVPDGKPLPPSPAQPAPSNPLRSNRRTRRRNQMSLAPGTYAVFTTTEGKITTRLFPEQAPKTVANFIELAEGTREWIHPKEGKKNGQKLYDSTIFHRVIPQFMIQGGDPAGTGMGGPGYRFEDETKGSPHKFDKPGKLAMANAGPNTNGSQFFITLANTDWLTGKHTIFGEVVEGQDVVEKISKVARNGQDKPHTAVVLESLVVEHIA